VLQSVTSALAVLDPAFAKYAPVDSGRKLKPLLAAQLVAALPAARNAETLTSASECSAGLLRQSAATVAGWCIVVGAAGPFYWRSRNAASLSSFELSPYVASFPAAYLSA